MGNVNKRLTADKTAEHQLKKYQFQKGVSGNPLGRGKGVRTKLGEAFVEDLLADWQTNGVAAIQAVRKSDPSTYLRVIAGLIPKEISIHGSRDSSLEKLFEQFTDNQLEEFDRAIAAITALPVN